MAIGKQLDLLYHQKISKQVICDLGMRHEEIFADLESSVFQVKGTKRALKGSLLCK